MHEEHLLRDLRRELEVVAARERAARISVVHLWVGALCHVTEPFLRDRWPETVRGTAAEGSRLEVERSVDLGHPRAARLVLASVRADENARSSPGVASRGGNP